MVGIGFTGRTGIGKRPLSLANMRTHIGQVEALLRGDAKQQSIPDELAEPPLEQPRHRQERRGYW